MTGPRAVGADGRYVLGAALGRGGQGALYDAEDRVLRRRVAIKLLLADGAGRAALQRFLREARLLARLRHPNLVEVFEVDVEAPEPFIAMELLEGRDLAAVLAAGELLTAGRGRELARVLAEALACLHANGVVHRDLKPANVFLCADGGVRLLDFGLALPLDRTRLTRTGNLVGTPFYLAPEVLHGCEHVPQSDVWQAGVVLHLAVAGTHPFAPDGDLPRMFGRLLEARPLEPRIAPVLPADLRAFVEACVRWDPAARPADGAAMVRLLEAPARDAEAAPAAPLARAAKPWRPAVAVILACLALAAALVVGLPPRALPDLEAQATEWLLFPDAVALAVTGDRSRPRTCRLELAGGEAREVPLAPSAGTWRGEASGLPAGAQGTVTLFEGGAPVARSSFALPATSLRAEARARYGLGALELTWAVHGRGPAEVSVAFTRGGPPMRQHVEGGRCVLPVNLDARGVEVSWRLAVAGRLVASDAGTLGPTVRYRRSPRCAVTGALPTPERGPLVVGDTVAFDYEEGLVLLSVSTGLRGCRLEDAPPEGPFPVARSPQPWGALAGEDGRGGLLVALAGPTWSLGRLAAGPGGTGSRLGWRTAVPGCPLAAVAYALPSGDLFTAGGAAEAGGVGLVAWLSAATGALRATGGMGGRRPLAALPFGGGVLLAWTDAAAAGLELHVPRDGTPAPVWTSALPPTRREAFLGRDSFAACRAPDREECLVAAGTKVLLVAASPGGVPVVREVPSVMPADAFVGAALALGADRWLLGVVVPWRDVDPLSLKQLSSRLALVEVRAPPGAPPAAALHYVQCVIGRPMHRCVDWGMVARAGRIYLALARHFLVVRDAPGFPLEQERFLSGAANRSPFVAGGALLVATANGVTIEGFDLVDEP